jgi:hypothetical protein
VIEGKWDEIERKPEIVKFLKDVFDVPDVILAPVLRYYLV